ncbi:MAG: hypothetical protein J6L69_03620 [Lachnospiraceae bacterium]|nr:hypothetical protein [Lachnospiraceae bacterium]
MIRFEEEINKFHPSLEVDEVENAIYDNKTIDLTDIMIELIKEEEN